MISSGTSKGRVGEQLASKYLMCAGFKIIEKNFRSSFGELDIIAIKCGIIYFCEVKTRWGLRYGYPEESVNVKKLNKIRKTIDYYFYKNKIPDQKIKILVISQLIQNKKLIYQKLIGLN